MKLSKYFNSTLSVAIIILALSTAHWISLKEQKPILFVSKQQSSLNIDNQFWTYFNLGQKRLASSLIWIATILESDNDRYKNRDLNSWMFLRFNTISFLEPLFYENYAFGGTYLSIVKDDLLGASIIYDKGLKFYPNDFNLLKDAGFHYYFEIGDLQKSLPIYKKLNKLTQNPIIASNLARLESEQGNLNDAFLILKERYDRIENKNSLIAKKISEHLYAIKAENDLNCLNKGVASINHCDLIDLDGNNYQIKFGKYVSAKNFEFFRTKSKLIK